MGNITEKALEDILKILDYVISNFLTKTITGIAIIIIIGIILLGIITISSQLCKITKNQEAIFRQLQNQMETQNEILNIMYKKLDEEKQSDKQENMLI